jgi:hypothetical protein
MPFKKGESGNKTGRPKGAENKLTKAARDVFIETLEGQVDNIQDAFDKVLKDSPARYLDLFAKYAQYFVPKKTETDIKGELRGSFDFNKTLKKLRGEDD